MSLHDLSIQTNVLSPHLHHLPVLRLEAESVREINYLLHGPMEAAHKQIWIHGLVPVFVGNQEKTGSNPAIWNGERAWGDRVVILIVPSRVRAQAPRFSLSGDDHHPLIELSVYMHCPY